MKISIAQIDTDINVPDNLEEILSNFSRFERDSLAVSTKYDFSNVLSIQINGKKVYSEGGLSWWNDNRHTEVTLIRENRAETHAKLHANGDWSQVDIQSTGEVSLGVFKTLSEIAFRTGILFHNGLVVHASAIKWNNKGIIFSAPSGTGKSTQAKLWAKIMGARILNEDRPALRVLDDNVYVYGTPWSGSSPVFENDKAPLSAIILLEQNKNNRIKKLSSSETVARLAPRCFLPYFDKSLMDMALKNLESIIFKTPVYLLECRPVIEALELVKQCVE